MKSSGVTRLRQDAPRGSAGSFTLGLNVAAVAIGAACNGWERCEIADHLGLSLLEL